MAKTLADFVREARARIRAISVEEFDEMIENHDDVLVVDVCQGRRASKPGRTFFVQRVFPVIPGVSACMSESWHGICRNFT